MYQEVIIINVWEMNLNTQKQINIRADKEQDIIYHFLKKMKMKLVIFLLSWKMMKSQTMQSITKRNNQ